LYRKEKEELIQTVNEKVSCFLERISGKNPVPLGSLAWNETERPAKDFELWVE
jgi:hypothetical protein